MTFNPLAAHWITRSLPHLPTRASVVELGNQRFTLEGHDLKRIEDNLRAKGRSFEKGVFDKIAGLSMDERKPYTSSFYKAVGFNSYKTIDLNSNFDALVMDLNHDLRSHYDFNEQFDLVTNIGTGEHIFNQYAVFKNMHQLTKVGGLMLHSVPFINYINHGFFNSNPILYFDIAEANDYEVVGMSFADRGAMSEVFVDMESESYEASQNVATLLKKKQTKKLHPVVQRLKEQAYRSYSKVYLKLNSEKLESIPLRAAVANLKTFETKEPMSVAIHKLRMTTTNIIITALLRKKSNNEFSVPIQGKYFHRIDLVAGKTL